MSEIERLAGRINWVLDLFVKALKFTAYAIALSLCLLLLYGLCSWYWSIIPANWKPASINEFLGGTLFLYFIAVVMAVRLDIERPAPLTATYLKLSSIRALPLFLALGAFIIICPGIVAFKSYVRGIITLEGPTAPRHVFNASDISVLTPAQHSEQSTPASQTLAACLLIAAQTYQLPPGVLLGILHVQDGSVGDDVVVNGQNLLGPMRINAAVLPSLADKWHTTLATAKDWLQNDGCVNLAVSAWILRQRINAESDLWKGIAQFPWLDADKGEVFAERVMAAMQANNLSDRMDKITNDMLNPNTTSGTSTKN